MITVITMGCADGFNFETVATYQASESDLTAEISAKGYIFHGDDLGDGLATGTISSGRFSDAIYFHTDPVALLWLTYKKDTLEVSNPYDMTLSLIHCFNTIGYANYNKQELEEFVEAIQLTAYGPKTTYMPGQTKFIKVLGVDFETY